MANVTRTIHIRVLTFDPAQRRRIPVPNARLLVEDRGWLWDPDLSDGSAATDADGRATVDITFDEASENSLNPYFTITLPEGDRTLPAAAQEEEQFELPGEWQTRHYVRRRLPRITDHTTPARPLEIFLGLESDLLVGYTDFDASGIRNPLALPEDTPRVHLADYDHFLWIDWLNPDDVMTGPAFDRRSGKVVRAGEGEKYPYGDEPPTAPSALLGEEAGPRAWIDPPGAPIGVLGGGSFESPGAIAVDPHGFVFIADGTRVRRFYPDGTLAETIAGSFGIPEGIAVDQFRNLYLADTSNNRIVVLGLDDRQSGAGQYAFLHALGRTGSGNGEFRRPTGLAVVPERTVDGEELLAVTDSDNRRVQLFRIEVRRTATNRSIRAQTTSGIRLHHFTSFGTSGAAAGEFQQPVAVAADRQRRLFVCDRQLHRVSRWALDAAGTAYTHEADWEVGSGASGAGEGEFDTPVAIAADWLNTSIYVAEEGNGRVQRLAADTGDHQTFWAPALDPDPGQPFAPSGVATDARGDVHVADATNRRIFRATTFDAEGSPLSADAEPAALGSAWTPADDPAHMTSPGYVYFDALGRLLVSDTGNDRLRRYERDANGALIEDEGARLTGIGRPVGIVEDGDGNVFIVASAAHQVVPHDAALTPQPPLGSRGGGDDEFDDPRGIAIAQRTEPILYVADRGNNRVQYLRRDGTFYGRLTSAGGTPFAAPEDVAVDSTGAITIADTGNGRIVRFVVDESGNHIFDREFVVPVKRAGSAARPCGVTVAARDELLVTDREQETIFLMEADGDLLAYWDLRGFLQVDISGGSEQEYYPELARQTLLSKPASAAIDDRGLLVIADTGHDRVRLLRAFTRIQANLTDLGEALPDISLRAITKNDWRDSIGLSLNVGDVSIFDESHDLKTTPEDDFSDDHYRHRQIINQRNSTNAAINVMKTARTVQRWLAVHTREDEPTGRWGTAENGRHLNVDLIGSEGSYQFLDVNLGQRSPHGRGSDAWDEPLIAHEMTHWVFFRAVQPLPPFSLFGLLEITRRHTISMLTSHNQAISEGWANYVQAFWGSEFSHVDRVRGYPMAAGSSLANVYPRGGDYQFLFGGPTSGGVLPTFDEPAQGQLSEGYFANALYQLHCALCDPGRRFADSPAFWHFQDSRVSEEASRRFSETIWRALRRFPNDPSADQLDRASRVYLINVLAQFHQEQPDFVQLARSIFELNNQLMPTIEITEGTSDTTAGTPIGNSVSLAAGAERDLVVRVLDATGAPVRGYNLHFAVGDAGDYALRSGAGPAARHGRKATPAAPASTTELWRATNANGIVNLRFTAPAQPGTTQALTVSYQPDFDTDETFAPPPPGSERETTLRQLYLYDLRTAAKTWSGTANNFGARVERTLTWEIT